MPRTSSEIFSQAPYVRRISRLTPHQLTDIDQYLHNLLQHEDGKLKKTHFFNQRYENIYLKSIEHPALSSLIGESLELCADLLQTKPDELSISYWFNLMEPGHSTTLHRHDDLDELISGVVYLTVPENSGDLIIEDIDQKITLKPVIGNFIFFDPTTPHAVTENKSSSHRLSIGMNFGLKANKD